MTHLFKPALAAGLALAALTSPLAVAPAAAQQTVRGIGVVNIQAVVANSTAYRTASEQRPVTYKAQIDQANARSQAIRQQLQPLYTRLQTDSQAASANQQALQQQAVQIQQIEQSGQQELQQILSPVLLSQAYVEEQIQERLSAAVEAAARKQNVSLVMTPENVLYAAEGYNLNQAVLTELNAALPAAQLVPPEGWLPRELREQQAAQAQAQAGGVAPTQPAVEGR